MNDTTVTRQPESRMEAVTVGRIRNVNRAAGVVIALMVFMSASAVAQAADVKVVIHPSSSLEEVSAKDVMRVFLKQKSRWPNGERAKPIDQKINADVREDFSEQVLGRTIKAVNSYWNSQVFAGKATPPPTAASDQEVLDFVRSTPGGVGYVSARTDTSNVKVLKVN